MKKLFIVYFILASAMLAAQDVPEEFSNPILSGYHPDPSICRVGDDYYLVNSSFEFFPGLPVYHSKDLVNWELIGYGITRPDQVELPSGLGDSRGLYAATIRFHEGVFYIINTCVQCNGNFYITATDPSGPWSNPVWLNSHGIDPSLFWDENGKCYYTGHGFRGEERAWEAEEGAWMQELDLNNGKLVGDWKQLTNGYASNARWTEGPHIYKIDGKYILLVAEGGTGFHHSVTIFNSDSLWGPYIPNHANPVMTHRNFGKEYPIHSIGHADLVQTQNGEWWAVMLGKRLTDSVTMLSRETFLTPVSIEYQEEKLTTVFNPGVGKLLPSQKRPDLPWHPFYKKSDKDEFLCDHLDLEWNFLRTPYLKWYTLKDGNLLMDLRKETVDELSNPSFIARRIEHFNFEASARLKFSSKKTNEQAGIIIYRNSKNYYTLLKSVNKVTLVMQSKGKSTELASIDIKAEDIFFKVSAKGINAKFYAGKSMDKLIQIGGEIDLSAVSDENAGGFNGPYVGMYATSNGKNSNAVASFDWFEYKKKCN